MDNEKRIVISGIGPLTSIGFGRDEVWESIINGRDGLTKEKVSLDGKALAEFFIYKIHDFDIDKFGLDKNILADIEKWKGEKGPLELYYFMAAIKLALKDSGLEGFKQRNRIGLILTHENPGLDQFYWQIINELLQGMAGKKERSVEEVFFEGFYKKFETRGYELQTFMFLFHVARVLDISGYSLFVNNACASGLYALEAAADAIKSGKCDVAIVAAVDCGSIFKHLWFKRMNVYAEDGRIKPFAKNPNGFVSGDCGAAIVVESMPSARRRKSRVYAEYAGGGFGVDTWKVVTPNPASDSYKNVMLDALKSSGVSGEDVDLVVPHGVAMAVTDYYEAKAISEIFGRNSAKPLITAFKPYIGHCLGASALVESILALLVMEKGEVPAVLNTKEVNPALGINLVKKLTRTNIKTVLKIACGFAGYNAAAVFRKV